MSDNTSTWLFDFEQAIGNIVDTIKIMSDVIEDIRKEVGIQDFTGDHTALSSKPMFLSSRHLAYSDVVKIIEQAKREFDAVYGAASMILEKLAKFNVEEDHTILLDIAYDGLVAQIEVLNTFSKKVQNYKNLLPIIDPKESYYFAKNFLVSVADACKILINEAIQVSQNYNIEITRANDRLKQSARDLGNAISEDELYKLLPKINPVL